VKGSQAGSILNLGPDSIFRPENFFPEGLSLYETTQKNDFYNASARLNAGFLMNETQFGSQGSRVIYGIRYESYFQSIEATELGKKIPTVNATTVADFLPSINIIYNINDQFGIRAAWSRTLNRPEFRELAGFTFFEPSQNVYFYGNPKLVRSAIRNIDVKGEWYPGPGSLLSLSLFHKNFTNPIEITRGFVTTLPTFTYTNRDAATSYGWEIEYRQRLSSLDSMLGTRFFSDISLFGNFSWIRSEVLYNKTNFKRPIHGQSPYIINAGVQYQYEPLALEVFLSYNRTGPRVAFLDDQNYAALIWERPRDIVDLSIGKTLGKWNIKIIGGDLLGQDLIQYIVLDRGGRKVDNQGLFGWISNTPNYQAGQDIPYFRFTNPRNLRFSISFSL
jgi:TonB-dependent receptor